ncbi:MAG TPA: serine O-acetyltransferase EpsC [Burkholderiaceae bacterium]|nr:serine O-acetyltransferase EpsC [Burkholderiaceae bacterium]
MDVALRLHADGDAAFVPRLNGALTRRHIGELTEDLLDLLFPGWFHPHDALGASPATTRAALAELRDQLSAVFGAAAGIDACPPLRSRHLMSRIVALFLHDLPRIRAMLLGDVRAAYDGDPAAQSIHEVVLAYPGFIAVATHRLAHRLHALGVPLVPRLMSEWAHSLTGIDIHPGATLGSGIFIDHGTGVVIGETAVVGDNVKLYHGVTLGAASTRQRINAKRHPTIQSNATLYAHATVLGGTTVVGENSTIGAAVLVASSVPENCAVIAERKHVVKSRAGAARAGAGLA